MTSQSEWALLIADEVQQQQEHQASFNSYRRVGTPGYRTTTLTRILDTVYFASSRSSRLLQAVDLIAFMHHRRETLVETDARAERANQQLWNKIAGRIAHRHLWVP